MQLSHFKAIFPNPSERCAAQWEPWDSSQPCNCFSECLSRSGFPTNTVKSLPQFTTHWHLCWQFWPGKFITQFSLVKNFVFTLQNCLPLQNTINTEGYKKYWRGNVILLVKKHVDRGNKCQLGKLQSSVENEHQSTHFPVFRRLKIQNLLLVNMALGKFFRFSWCLTGRISIWIFLPAGSTSRAIWNLKINLSCVGFLCLFLFWKNLPRLREKDGISFSLEEYQVTRMQSFQKMRDHYTQVLTIQWTSEETIITTKNF